MIPLTLIVYEVKDQTILVRNSDGKTVELPKTAIHGGVKIGQEIRLIGVALGSEESGQTELAKSLLNELLG